MSRPRNRRTWVPATILLCPLLLGTTYKWVDEQGQVHFTDSAPPTGTAHEIVATPRSSPTASSPSRTPLEVTSGAAQAAAPAAVTESLPPQVVADDAGASLRETRCIDALYQLEVLAGDWKVYKPGPGNDRTYLNDRDRPSEVKRLTAERDANCSNDAAVLASQTRRAGELFEALSPGCREAREKLQNLQRPTARSAPSDLQKQQAYIGEHCPDLSRDGVWLADWIWVRHR